MGKTIKLSAKQKEVITNMRGKAYGTTGIHGLSGYDSVFTPYITIKSLMAAGIVRYEGHTMNDKAALYSLTELGKTIKLN